MLLLLLVTWLASLLDAGGGLPGPANPAPPLPPQGATGFPTSPPAWSEILRSLIFWWVFAFAVIYVLKTYLSDHPELLASLKRFGPFYWAYAVFATLVVWLAQLVQGGLALLPAGAALPPSPAGSRPARARWRRSRLNSLSRRGQILYYYLKMLQQAEEMIGLVRQRHQTPYEFALQLGQARPDLAAEVDFLTSAFVQARYSPEGLDEEHVALVKTVWRRVEAALGEARSSRLKIQQRMTERNG